MQYSKTLPFLILGALLVGVALMFGLFYLAPTEPEKPSSPLEVVRIGGVVTLSGSRGPSYGIPMQRAAQLAIDEINQRGGIRGQQIQVAWEDGKCDPEAAKTAANKLINAIRVHAILGGICSSETLALAPLAEAQRVLVISPASTGPEISQAGAYIYRLAPSDTLVAEVYAAIMLREGKKTVAIISEEAAYARGIRDAFVSRFTASGGQVVYNEVYKTGDRNSAALATKAAAAKADAVFLIPVSPTQGLQQLIQLERMKTSSKIFVGEAMLDAQVISQNAEVMEGITGVIGYFDKDVQRAKKFLDSYREQFAEEPMFPFYMSNMYDAVYLLKEGLERSGGSVEKTKEWLSELKRWEGASGTVVFDANGDPLRKFTIVAVSGGEMKSVEVYDTAK